MNRIFEEALDIIYPENLYCPCCGDIVGKGRALSLCDRCIGSISWLSENPFSRKEGFSFDEVISVASYDVAIEKMIYELKFSGKSYLAKDMGHLMGEVFKESFKEDFIMVPVPMYKEKEWQRGYNQAELLAYFAGKSSENKMLKALIKTKATASMRMSRIDQRPDVLAGSIELNPKFLREIEGANIAIVDDVITTGSTAEACSKLFRDFGVKKIVILSFAAVNFKGK